MLAFYFPDEAMEQYIVKSCVRGSFSVPRNRKPNTIGIGNKANLSSQIRISKLALRLVNLVTQGPGFLPSFCFAKLKESVLS